MNKQILIGGGIVALIIIGAIAYSSGRDNEQVAADSIMNNNASLPTENTTEPKSSVESDSNTKTPLENNENQNPSDETKNPGSYKNFSEGSIQSESSLGNKVVLFFHAPWCSFCKVADTAFSNRTKEIPSGVSVLKTDYDSSDELKKKYGVSYQHTFVQVDSNGEMITKWNGGDIDSLIKNLK